MIKKSIKVFAVASIILIILLTSIACTKYVPQAKAESNSTNSNINTTISLRNAFTNNVTPITTGGPANLGPGSIITGHTETNVTVLPQRVLNLSQGQMQNTPDPSTNSNVSANGFSPLDDPRQYWHLTDFWQQPSILPYDAPPLTISGTFIAVPNTIQGMTTGSYDDKLFYEPLNIAWGTTNNYRWIQFVVIFDAEDDLPTWTLYCQDSPSGYYYWPSINATYIPYDQYQFSLYSSSSNTVTFTLEDISSTYDNHCAPVTINVPTTNFIVCDSSAYSPASCVEGLMRPSTTQITNVPFFQTYLEFSYPFEHYGGSILFGDDGHPPTGVRPDCCYTQGNQYDIYWEMHSQTYVSSVVSNQWGPYGNGVVNNPYNIVGTKDGDDAEIYGSVYGSGGYITGQMNAPSGGNIYIRGSSAPGYSSDLYVYVSNDDQHWVQIGNSITITQNSDYWISVGQYMGDFNWISIAGYDPGNNPVNLYVDAVAIGADPEVTVLVFDESSGNYVNGIPISIDGNWVSSGNVFDLSDLDHVFQAPDADGGGAFIGFYDGTDWYGNPADITTLEAMTITAYYNYIPTYTLTMYATDQYGQGSVPVGIDGNLVGYTPLSIPISLGYHTIAVPGSGGYLQFLDLQDGGAYYADGASIPITSDTTITAQYLYW